MKLVNFKRPVTSQWLVKEGRRLDANPFLSGAVEARLLLESLDVPKEPLHTLTKGHNGGIYMSGRGQRIYVDDPQHGTPYLTTSSILQADLSGIPRLANRLVKRDPLLRVREGMTLITRSGTIGRMAYCRSDMDGMACCEDVLRVVPDPDKIPPGYLYAYLSSKYGVPLVVSGTYGAIIQHIEPEHVAGLPVPRFAPEQELNISTLVEKAAKERADASALIAKAETTFADCNGLPELEAPGPVTSFSSFSVDSRELRRFDAQYFCPSGREATSALCATKTDVRRLGDVCRVFTPSIFKRMHVDDIDHGYAYYGGSELFQSNPEPRGFLSRGAPRIADYIVHTNWLLIQDAGQLGGLIGRPVRVAANQEMAVVSNHMIRLCFVSREDAAYAFAALRSVYGYRAVTRLAFGKSIPQIDPVDIARIDIPWPSAKGRCAVGDLVLEAWRKQEEADLCAAAVVKQVESLVKGAAHG